MEKAKLAKEKHENAQEKEEEILSNYNKLFEEEIHSTRENYSSKVINEFNPIVSYNNGKSLQVTSDATTNDNTKIVGYAYLLNNEVKGYTAEDTYNFTDLDIDTEYIINVIAMDKSGKIKVSSELKVKTSDQVYLYKGQNEFKELTGGWSCPRLANWISGYKTIYQDANGTTTMKSTNKINISNQKYLEFNLGLCTNGQGYNNTTIGISSDGVNFYKSKLISTQYKSSATGEREKHSEYIDISNVNGEYYIMITVNHPETGYSAYTTIYEILTKK